LATRATRKRIARPRRPTRRRGRRLGLASLLTLGTLVVLGTAALVLVAVDPRTDAVVRRGLSDARSAARQLPSVRLPAPSLESLENLARQIGDAARGLGVQLRDAARRNF